MGIGISMKNIILLIALSVAANMAHATCTAPISRTNNTANQVLTSTKYNQDLNTVYSKVNNLPGDCIQDDSVTAAKIADESVTTDKLAPGVLSGFIPAGTILPYAGAVAPTGFLLCNGQAVSRTTYDDLYDVVGTSFGSGNGSTTFNVPDMRGRFLRGVDGGAGNDPDRLTRTAMSSGGNTGDQVGSVQLDAFQNITGAFTMSDNSATAQKVRVATASGIFFGSNTSSSVAGMDSGTVPGVNTQLNFDASLTARTSTETRPKNANVNFIIKI